MEKVTVSKEVAEAIEVLRKVGKTDEEIVRVLANPNDRWLTAELQPLNEAPLANVIKAIFIGYEVEKAPEDAVREYFEELVGCEDALEHNGASGSQFRQGWQSVKHTLELLGIRIKGVNA